jgi:hypothetical protein
MHWGRFAPGRSRGDGYPSVMSTRGLVWFGLGAVLAACGGVTEYTRECEGRPGPGSTTIDAGASVPDAAPAGSHGEQDPDAGTGTSTSALAQSGSRLRAVYIQTSDGARQRTGWYDRARSEDCSFAKATTDDVERCLPRRYPFGRLGGSHFTDPHCSQEVFAQRGEDCPATGVRSYRYISLPDGVHALGERIHPANPYHRDANGNCTPETASGVEYYATGPLVAASAFISATTQVEPPATGARLTYVSRFASDGSRERLFTFDTALGTTCSATVASDDLLRCGPSSVGTFLVNRFADTACSAPVIDCSWSLNCAPRPWSASAFVATFTGPRFRATFFQAKAYPSGSSAFFARDVGGACIATSEGPEGRAVGVAGDEIPASSLARVSDGYEGTLTRLQRRIYSVPPRDTDPGLRELPELPSPYQWRDTALQEVCSFEPTADGRLRCVPGDAVFHGIYTDPTCTDVKVESRDSPRYLRVGTGSCDLRVRRIANKVSFWSAPYYVMADDDGDGVSNCTSRKRSEGIYLLEVGEEMTENLEIGVRVIE